MERSICNLRSDDRERVVELLFKYQDVFSSGEFDTGRTT